MAENNGFTPTERRMLDLLSDGKWHAREELWKLLDDDLASMDGIRVHMHNIRVKIRPRRHLIICELCNRRIGYRYAAEVLDPA